MRVTTVGAFVDVYDIKTDSLVIKRASSNLSLEDLLSTVKKLNNGKKVVQLFDPEWIVNRTQIIGAYANALVVFDNHKSKTNILGMEMLLFAALTDQIGDAIGIAGAKSSSNFIIFSNDKSILNKLKSAVTIHSDFNPGTAEIKKKALSIGIKEGNNIDIMILQKMALSRLSSD